MNENNFLASLFYTIYTIVSYIVTLFGGIVITCFCGYIFIKTDGIEKMIIVPFMIAGISVIIKGLSNIIKSILSYKARKMADNGNFDNAKELEEKSQIADGGNKFADNLYLFAFAFFWFGFLIVYDFLAIKSWNDGGNILFFFSIIFWIAGIYMIITKIKK